MTESTPAPDEPPTALPPPAVIRVLTINVQGGLTPNLSQANCTKDKLARAVDFLDAGYVCVCAQECGFPSDSPPPLSRRTSSARERPSGALVVAGAGKLRLPSSLLLDGTLLKSFAMIARSPPRAASVRRLRTAPTLCSLLPSSFPRTLTPPATVGRPMSPSAPHAGLQPV